MMIPDYMINFCDNWVRLKDSKDDTAMLTAEKYRDYTGMNISAKNIRRYWSKKGLPKGIEMGTILEVARYYHVSVDWLIGRRKKSDEEQKYQVAKEITGLSDKAVRKLNVASKDPEKKQMVKNLSDIIENPATDQYAGALAEGIKAFEGELTDKAEVIIKKKLPETKAEMSLKLHNMPITISDTGFNSQIKDIISEMVIARTLKKLGRKYHIKSR